MTYPILISDYLFTTSDHNVTNVNVAVTYNSSSLVDITNENDFVALKGQIATYANNLNNKGYHNASFNVTAPLTVVLEKTGSVTTTGEVGTTPSVTAPSVPSYTLPA